MPIDAITIKKLCYQQKLTLKGWLFRPVYCFKVMYEYGCIFKTLTDKSLEATRKRKHRSWEYKQYKQSRINRNGLNVLCGLAQFTWKWCSYNTVGPVFFGGMGYLIGKWFRQFRNCLAALVETVQRTHDWFSLNVSSF